MDLFLEKQVRDLLATAKHQDPDSAAQTYRTALALTDGALALDSRNETALSLRQEIAFAMGTVAPVEPLRQEIASAVETVAPVEVAAPSIAEPNNARRPSEPKFGLLPEGDVPAFEYIPAAERFLSDRGRDLGADPDMQSILDPTPRPVERNYLAYIFAFIAVMFLGVGLRAAWYYLTPHYLVDTAPLEARAKYVPQPGAVQPPPPVTGPTDDTIYMAQSGITLPELQFKPDPPHVNGVQGRVVILALIDPSGRPGGMKIWQGLNPDANVAALQTAGRWRFRPGTKDGKPTPVVAQIIINFQ